jgi:hypothetical protein
MRKQQTYYNKVKFCFKAITIKYRCDFITEDIPISGTVDIQFGLGAELIDLGTKLKIDIVVSSYGCVFNLT